MWLDEHANEADALRAYAHASLLARLRHDAGAAVPSGGSSSETGGNADCSTAMDVFMPLLQRELAAAGWTLDHAFLAEDATRLRVLALADASNARS